MYILKISNVAFIEDKIEKFSIISNYEKATRYNSIGEAMKRASELNEQLNIPIIKLISVSSNL